MELKFHLICGIIKLNRMSIIIPIYGYTYILLSILIDKIWHRLTYYAHTYGLTTYFHRNDIKITRACILQHFKTM